MVKNPHIDHWHEALDQLLDDYDINTPLRVDGFASNSDLLEFVAPH